MIAEDWIASRCKSTDGSLRCVGTEDHAGPHWASLVGDRAMRWGMRGIGCFDPGCVKEPGHGRPHNDGKGTSWWPMDAEDFALLAVEVSGR